MPSVRPPSQRRSAIAKRAAEKEAGTPTPPTKRRRPLTSAAGSPNVSTPPTGALTNTAEMVALVTREVMQQLRQDRADAPPPPDFPVREDVPVAPPVVSSLPHQDQLSADPMDTAVTGALNSLLQGDISASPMSTSLPMHSTALGATLSDRIKGKIWADEYVNFHELTDSSQPQPQQVSFASGSQVFTLMPQPSKGKQIATIEQWTSAFLVFGATYTQRFSNSAPGLFKYCDIVRDIAVTGPLFAWRQYDEQFRQFRQSDPVSFPWDQPRWDLFFKVMYAKPVQGVAPHDNLQNIQ